MISIFNPWVMLGAVLWTLSVFGSGVYSGHHYGWLQDQAEVAAQAKQTVADVIDQSTTTGKVEAKAADAQEKIRIVYRNIIKKEKEYVPVEVERACVIAVGFVSLFNAAAAGTAPVPDPAGRPNAAASGVGVATVAGSVVVNFETYHRVAQQLTDLQAWITEQATNDQRFRARDAR